MDISKWKSCAVDIDSYCIIRAMGKNGFRRPGSMIAKLVDEEIKKIARKEGKSYQNMKENLLSQLGVCASLSSFLRSISSHNRLVATSVFIK